MADRSWILSLVLVLVVIAAGTGGLVWFYFHEAPAASAGPATVAIGGNVTVNYIGVFGSGPETGRIFDTSIYGIGSNPVYAKALEFHNRGAPKNYTPLPVYVGGSTPSGGYSRGNLSFIQVVPGFWQGLVGMEPNSTRVIVIPPPLAYGPTISACVLTKPLVEKVPMLVTLPGALFQTDFPGITSASGEEFTDPFYGWTDQILSANSSFVTLQRLPYIGETTNLSGWPVTVTSVAPTANGSGVATVENELTPTMAGHILGKDYLGTGPCGQTSQKQFIVTSVDLGRGTFTENFNQEVQNQTLVFTMTVVDYFPNK